ncbi:MAG: SMP-30/gluconolactonase/LRE family protein [Saprospiraceae bacterium]|nr:SMP-30/gluconolactonase/LRE family protein [Saprospiraceae bacterium]
MKWTAEPIFHTKATHGEGPVWDEIHQELYWVDIPEGRYYKGKPSTGASSTFMVGQDIGVLALRQEGGIVMAVRDGFGLYDASTQQLQLIEPSPEQENALVRFNDGAVDPYGRFLAGTMAYDEVSCLGKLFSLNSDHQWITLAHDLYITNGMAWNQKGDQFFMIDTLQHCVFSYDYDSASGLISNRNRHIEFPKTVYPDGMCTDSEDGFWIAFYGMGKVIHFDPKGQQIEEIEVPAPHTTSCCFGGEDLQTLFITTSCRDLNAQQKETFPHAGRTFRVETGVKGKREPRFKG